MSKTIFTVYPGKNSPREPTGPITIRSDFTGDENDLYKLLEKSFLNNLETDWYVCYEQNGVGLQISLQANGTRHVISGNITDRLKFVLSLLEKKIITKATFYREVQKIKRII
jgi:hypothetical protein